MLIFFLVDSPLGLLVPADLVPEIETFYDAIQFFIFIIIFFNTKLQVP